VILTEAKSAPSLDDIYLNHCALQYDDPSWLLSASHEYLESADGQSSMTHEERKRKVYDEACNFIPPTILHDRISKSCRSISEAYSARREYACQLGLNAGVQYLLSAPALSPDQMLVCCRSGVMVTTGVAPSYRLSTPPQSSLSPSGRMGSRIRSGIADMDTDDKHLECLERNANLPFRLTRNVVGALSGYMVLGGLTVSLGLTMDACLTNKDVIEVSLSLLLIGDLRSRRAATAAVDCYPSVALVKVQRCFPIQASI
jgi:phosphatidylinositol kinase/protein kinase (PI-3  family)